MVRGKKNAKPTTKKELEEKDLGIKPVKPVVPTWHGTIRELLGWKDAVLTPAFVEALADKMMEWSRNEESYDFQQFYSMVGIPRNSYEFLRTKHPLLEEAYQMTTDVIGERRQRRLFALVPQSMSRTLRYYHRDHRKAHDEDVESKNKNPQPSTINVTLPDFTKED